MGLVNKSLFFEALPKIRWNKVYCPMCNARTGANEECQSFNKKVPMHQRLIQMPVYGTIPILVPGCFFKTNNLWSIELNYPASKILQSKILSVRGVNKCIPSNQWTFVLTINPLFDEQEVQQKVNEKFNTFIKEMQMLERQTLSPSPDVKLGIRFPNGNEFYAQTPAEMDIIESMLSEVSGSLRLEGNST